MLPSHVDCEYLSGSVAIKTNSFFYPLSRTMVVHFNEEYERAASVKNSHEPVDFSETPECAHCRKEDPKVLL